MRQFKTLTAGMLAACILLLRLPAWAQDQIREIPPAEGSPPAAAVYLADLEPTALMDQPVPKPSPSGTKRYVTGPATCRNQEFTRSISIGNAFPNTPASVMFLNRDGFDCFEATVCIKDDYPTDADAFTFTVTGDNQELARVPGLRAGDNPVPLRVPIRQVTRLKLAVDPGLNVAPGSVWWGDARLVRDNVQTGTVCGR